MNKPLTALCIILLACPVALGQGPVEGSGTPGRLPDLLVPGEKIESVKKEPAPPVENQMAPGESIVIVSEEPIAQGPADSPLGSVLQRIVAIKEELIGQGSAPGAVAAAPGNVVDAGTVNEGEIVVFEGNGDPNRFWASLEYLLFWIKDGGAPPLVTTNTQGGAPTLGNPGTVAVFGGNFDYNTFSGMRLSGGVWLNPEGTLGIESSSFLLEHRTAQFTAGSLGSPVLFRPFFDVFAAPPVQSGVFISSPRAFAGSFEASTGTHLWGNEVSAAFRPDPTSPWKFLLGFRYLELNENLALWQQTNVLPGNVDFLFLNNPAVVAAGGIVGPATLHFTDVFSARNQFYGAQLGVQRTFDFGPVSLFLSAKIGLGDTHEVVDIAGSKSVTSPTLGTLTAPGGILTQITNIGRQTRNPFSAIPDLEARINYALTDQLKLFVGYNFFYWGNVVRPGSQIDLNVNGAVLATGTAVAPARPAPQFNQSDFWAQGITFGLMFQY